MKYFKYGHGKWHVAPLEKDLHLSASQIRAGFKALAMAWSKLNTPLNITNDEKDKNLGKEKPN